MPAFKLILLLCHYSGYTTTMEDDNTTYFARECFINRVILMLFSMYIDNKHLF